MYSLVMRCQKALVQGSTTWRFRKKVTTEILPEIRRTGSYGAVAAPKPIDPMAFLSNPHNAMQLVAQYAQRTIQLEGVVAEQGQALAVARDTIQEQAVTVAAHDLIANADGAYCVTDVAKLLGVRPSALFVYMRNTEASVRWFYQRTKGGDDIGWQERLDAEELVEVPETVSVKKADGTVLDKLVIKLRVTPLGITKLALLLVEAKDEHLPTPIDLVHLVRQSRDDMTSRPRAKGGDPGLFD
ncbi:phage antirepressor KilAC domain-containing protein [Methylobacterium pseudosasicola]|uniref:Phage antirepressor protein KilAC domain-containing protein n=1 Tax=Methylobacterium pseudosasicola TaxID=582667 RepID=A0A1I4QNJ9_9HYPH|nr:phage antirepressor KilAC domain-containing protein [Methylobacterium pseudosasicola]SFM41286.1 Phage antirepressor protein KilAC domain-containing protein [Methylobacterium pseudosasicola]